MDLLWLIICIVIPGLCFFYAILILWIVRRWKAQDETPPYDSLNFPGISIVIVGRNESQNIGACLKSIVDCKYPFDKHEIIFVDDHSEDDTLRMLETLSLTNLTVIELAAEDVSKFGKAYKKAGQYAGVQKATFDFVVCTDADCQVPNTWLEAYAKTILKKAPDFITGMVKYHEASGLLSLFQRIDLLGTMAFTKAGIVSGKYYLANGANMGFVKKQYLSYIKDTLCDRASGDDVFLAQYMARHRAKIEFLDSAEACVLTREERDISGFISQRVRWGTKTMAYTEGSIKWILFVVFSFHAACLMALVMGIIIEVRILWVFILMYGVKGSMDMYLIYSMRPHSNPIPGPVKWCLLIAYHILYHLFIGIASLTIKDYMWKGRKVR